MWTALAELCATVGVAHEGARLLRFTNNAVYRLARDPIVVRIVGSRALRHRADKVVWFANRLADQEVPATRLLPGIAQPVRVGEFVATFWLAESSLPGRARTTQLAALLRRLHALPVLDSDGGKLPDWDPLADVRARLADAEEGLADAELRYLAEECAELSAALAELALPHRGSLVHGDAHLGNVINSAVGPVLCDFDSACLGPPEWDLTPLAVGVRRFGESRRGYRRFVHEYGFDVTDWNGFSVLRRVRELKLTTSVLPILRSKPEVTGELRRRLRDLRKGNDRAHWRRFR
ncbi:phosphotransferase family enzyme [Tamaricihabitans halophyticus]|uniref:Phosphotransferase family enzyme n=1 Tax=Tamaricihabitans halophyticus TaxID=1262583 RepID=A0A4R2QXL5_9PSEU|nr:phosphotransferase family enzyme [Tamaricihabitans halophyticus]